VFKLNHTGGTSGFTITQTGGTNNNVLDLTTTGDGHTVTVTQQ